MIGRWKRRGNHLATAKLAVKRHLSWTAWLLLTVAIASGLTLAGYGVYRYGRAVGMTDAEAQAGIQSAAPQIARMTTELGDARQRLGAITQQLRVEQTTRETLSHQLQQLQTDNGGLREQIAFYESLLTKTDRAPALSLEALQVEPLVPGRYRLRAVLVQGQSTQEAFKGEAEFHFLIERNGKRSEMSWPSTRLPITVTRFTRIEREAEIPADAKLRQVQIRIYAQGDNRVRLSRSYDVKG